ncbi:MAG: replicative DNA helicase [Alphaproteobacteria bacterium]
MDMDDFDLIDDEPNTQKPKAEPQPQPKQVVEEGEAQLDDDPFADLIIAPQNGADSYYQGHEEQALIQSNNDIPYNLEAEKALLGAIILDSNALMRVSEFLMAEHFVINAHRKIFKTMLDMENRQHIINEVTLAGYFKSDPDLLELGGIEYLRELGGSAVSTYSAESYARIIYDSHLRRQLIEIGHEISDRATSVDAEGKAEEEISLAEERLYNLAETGNFRTGFTGFDASLEKALEIAYKAHQRGDSLAGITTGINAIDKLFGGMQRSDLIIVAGRPAMGKTALAANIAWAAATKAYAEMQAKGQIDNGAVVGFFSLEMSYDQLALRILSQETGISGQAIRRGDITDQQYDSLHNVASKLREIPFFIDDTPGQTIATIRSRARRLKRTQNLGLLVIDYIQLISGNSRDVNRVQEVAEITRGLKNLAKELEIPVIALSQLSRQVENREDKRPQMSDLRESGSIEQDADIIMFVFRREYYIQNERPDDEDSDAMNRWEERMERNRNKGSVIVGKNRHGDTPDIQLHFDKSRTKFSDLETRYNPDDIH